MARMTFEELNVALDDCISVGVIFNVDYQDLKTYVATRMVEEELQDVTNRLFLAIDHKIRSTASDDLYYGRGGSIVQFPSKALLKAVKTSIDAGNDNGYGAAVQSVIAKWASVADKFRALKPMIQMGRKPSETPRTTPVRTLENTGTCSCCGMNVKLKDGKIVAHGFTIRYGWQQGVCFGQGYEPIEAAPTGTIAYRDHLLGLVEDRARSQVRLITDRPILKTYYKGIVKHVFEDADGQPYQRELNLRIEEIDSEIRQLNYSIASLTKTITNWTPGVLPG